MTDDTQAHPMVDTLVRIIDASFADGSTSRQLAESIDLEFVCMMAELYETQRRATARITELHDELDALRSSTPARPDLDERGETIKALVSAIGALAEALRLVKGAA